MKKLSERFPEGMTYEIVYDTTPFVKESIANVIDTLRDAILLVVLIVFIFLQTWRAAVIPVIAIPVSLVATFAVMYVASFSINVVTMLGMVLAVGLVVDDAIVVVENVERRLRMGATSVRDAVKAAMADVTGPIVATTSVLMAVFIPVTFLPGISGEL
jgi:multidrug efflux pump subunit AcrB